MSNEDDPTSHKAMVTKGCLALGIFLLGFFSTLLPRYLARTNAAQRWLSLGNMAASGILLAAGLVHMLADSSGDLDTEDGFPWAFFASGMTCVCLMILEEVTHLIAITMTSKNRANKEDEEETGHKNSTNNDEETGRQTTSQPHAQEDQDQAVPSKGETLHSKESDLKANTQPLQHDHHEDYVNLHVHGSIIATSILMLAISVHSVLAGISMGVEGSYKDLLSTAIAILAHKAFVGFALGSSLVNARIGPSSGFIFWFFCLGFALTTPIGVFIGIGIVKGEGNGPDGSRSVAIVKAIVSGTFLYISIVEIAAKELMACRTEYEKHGSVAQKLWDVTNLFIFAAGYGAMSSLALAV
eukprot:scaffold360_cov107-Cylindrotheca_fusiformis.AAC.8